MLAIALIPCAALLVTSGTAVILLAQDARSSAAWSDYLSLQMDPAVRLAVAAHEERSSSLLALTGDAQAIASLPTRRESTDQIFAELAQVATKMDDLNAQAVAKSTPAFVDTIARLPQVRRSVDTGQATIAEVAGFFAKLAEIIVLGLEGSARHTPDSESAAEQMTAAGLLQVSDFQSRTMGTAAAATTAGTLLPIDRRALAQLVGAYRHQLESMAPRLTDSGRARYHALTESTQWHTAVTVEDILTEQGTMSAPVEEWQNAATWVHSELLAMFHEHGRYAAGIAEASATRSFTRLVVAGTASVGAAVGAFALALMLATRLVGRLRSLRSTSLELAEEKLPSIIRRIHGGEEVDLEAETAVLDTGTDEIGEVAHAFGTAQRTAVAAAVAEARTRDGFGMVFLDIAYRNQTLIRRQLEILDVAENRQDDPEHLELLFRLDHLATRARRNAENLVILGGGRPGRRWRQPMPLEEIVRSAVSETEDFARVGAVRLPDTHVSAGAVADLVHLLAELVDNASSFSPPQSPISVLGHFVGKGVAVEVEDQGLGMVPAERERLNDLLRNSADFQEMALAGKRHLGLFVVSRLARRHSISVSLQESAYGGIKAIVLIPVTLLPTLPAAVIHPEAHRPIPLPRTITHDRRELPALTQPEKRSTAQTAVSEAETSQVLETLKPGVSTKPRHQRPPQNPRSNRPELPQRQRQSHLSPQLRLDAEEPRTEAAPSRGPRQDAAATRDAMASFQRGTRHARASNNHPTNDRTAEQ